MTNKRERIIEELAKLWIKHPNQRFGQLMFNYTRFGTRAGLGIVFDSFHYSDNDILGDLIEANKEE